LIDTRILALFLLVCTSAADARADATAPLSVRVTALRSNRGHVGCMLFGSAAGFPKDPNAALQKKWCAIANATATCAFDPTPAGTYAVACFHDENDNGKLDTGIFGIPKEGTVVSNRAHGTLGPPSWDAAKFAFAGRPTELVLPISY
jgi:uncharacterized protein (DUF2141 family)